MQSIDYPKEYWPDNSIYFYTDSTYLHKPLFRHYEQKMIVLNQIKKLNKSLKIPISAYSIAINHFHLKFYLVNGSLMGKVRQLLRGGISYEYKKRFALDNDFWQTRKIIRIKNEQMDWKVSAYIIGNLLKHKEVGTFKDLYENDFNSFSFMADKYGKEEITDLVRQVIDVREDGLGGVDLADFEDVGVSTDRIKELKSSKTRAKAR